MIPLLASLADVDAAWLEAMLRAAGHDMQVHGFELAPIGAGNVSDTARIRIDASGDGPRTLIAKFRPVGEAAHAHGVASGAYRCETGAYRLLTERGDDCRIPRVLWVDGADDTINLVMEDLSQSTRPGSQITGCGPDDAAAVITQLARLHRAFWPMDEARAPGWLLRMPACGDYWVPITIQGAPAIEARLRDRIPEAYLDVVRDAAPLSRAWHDLRHSAMTITHGDPRADNILFDHRADLPEAILIDWQVAGLRNPMHDVGYFLSTSLTAEDRRAQERGLLDLYADEFGRTRGYAPGRMIDDYRVQIVGGLMTVIAAAAVLPDEDRANRLLATLLERTCPAAIDWKSLEAIRARA